MFTMQTASDLSTRARALLVDRQIPETARAGLRLALDTFDGASLALQRTWEHLRAAILDVDTACLDVTMSTCESTAHKFDDVHYSKVTTAARIAAQGSAARALLAAMREAEKGKADFLALMRREAEKPVYDDGKSIALRVFDALHAPDLSPTECDEIAASMSDRAPRFAAFDDAAQWVRSRMPGESCTVIDNTAESLFNSQKGEWSTVTIETISPDTYARERAICDTAQAYAESVMTDPTTGKRRNWMSADECAHPDYAACDNDMRGRVEQFEILRDRPDVVFAYLSGDDRLGRWDVTVWTGRAIGRAEVVSSWRVRSFIGSRMYAVRATIAGKLYHGRGFGNGMCIRLKASQS